MKRPNQLLTPAYPRPPNPEAMQIDKERNEATPTSNWWVPYLEYLLRGELPPDKVMAQRLAQQAKSFVLLGEEKELYQCNPSRILQRCIPINQGQELLSKIHSRACVHHATPRTLIGNTFR
jgi:hypothetical protein